MSINLTAGFILCSLMNVRQSFIRGKTACAAADGTIVIRMLTGLQKKAPSEVKQAEDVFGDEPMKRKRRPLNAPAGAASTFMGTVRYQRLAPRLRQKKAPAWLGELAPAADGYLYSYRSRAAVKITIVYGHEGHSASYR